MKIIYSKSEHVANRITTVTASDENGEYPASNLILGDVSKIYRSLYGGIVYVIDNNGKTIVDDLGNNLVASSGDPVVLTVSVPQGVNNALSIFGANMQSVQVEVKDTSESTTYSDQTFDLDPGRKYNRLWCEWTNNDEALHIIITLQNPGTTYFEIAEIVVGTIIQIPDPRYGLGQARENLQVIQKKAGGGFYIFDRPKPRSFDLSFLMDRELEFDDLDEIYEKMGQMPLSMLLSEITENNMKWCGFFHVMSPPKASHDYLKKSVITVSLREAV